MADFRMPTLGAEMESGKLLEWRVKPGEAVRRGDIVAVIDTDKAEIEVEIFEDGVIEELLVPEGTRVPVGTVLATVRAVTRDGAPAAAEDRRPEAPAAQTAPLPAAEEAPLPQPQPPSRAAPLPSRAEAPPAARAPAARAHAGRIHISPVARRMIEELGLDAEAIRGSGPDGAITKADVERVVHAASPPASQPGGPAAVEERAASAADRQAAMRDAIGALMARSKREIPHYYLRTEIDTSRAIAWMTEANLRRPVDKRFISSVLLLGAVARAVAQTPVMNGFWVDGAFRAGSGVHLGVAIALRGGGLVAPAIHDADSKTLDELMAAVRDLVARARSGRLRGSEMSDPTITVTNLGEQGVDLVHGVIYAPQVALVGFGGIRERPWAADGMIGARPTVNATLAADHRASDGHAGSRFLALIDRLLQTPEEL